MSGRPKGLTHSHEIAFRCPSWIPAPRLREVKLRGNDRKCSSHAYSTTGRAEGRSPSAFFSISPKIGGSRGLTSEQIAAPSPDKARSMGRNDRCVVAGMPTLSFSLSHQGRGIASSDTGRAEGLRPSAFLFTPPLPKGDQGGLAPGIGVPPNCELSAHGS